VKNPLNDDWQRRHFGLTVTHPLVQTACDHAKKLLFDWCQNKDPHLLVLAGHVGCGKTTLMDDSVKFARHAAITVWEKGSWPNKVPTVHRVEWPSLCAAVEDKSITLEDALKDAIDCDFLGLDELGAETDRYKSGIFISALATLLGRRARKWTLAVTNVPPSKWSTVWDVRVDDRFFRNSTILDMSKVPSYSKNGDDI